MAANIQAALQAMTNVGSGNVAVTVDAANSKGSVDRYRCQMQPQNSHSNVSSWQSHLEFGV